MDVLALPAHLVQYVVALAATPRDGDSDAGVAYTVSDGVQFVPTSPKSALQQMPQLALVSRAWHYFMLEMERKHCARIYTLVIRPTTDATSEDATDSDNTELEAIYDAIAATNGALLELRIVMRELNTVSGLFTMRQECKQLEALERLAVDWHGIFRHCSKLLRLDLTAVPLNGTGILHHILDAASTHCKHLQALTLPGTGMGVSDRDVDLVPVLADLYRALERWHTHGPKRGLIQLTVPKRHHFSESDARLQQRSNEFLTAVAQWCPNVQYLDGWRATYTASTDLRCDEVWFCSLAVWTRFCASCTRLRAFNWFVAPFDSEFLTAFGAAGPKTAMTSMTIACGNDEFFSDALLSGEYVRPGGFTFSSAAVASVLTACPALRALHVVLGKRLYRSMWLHDCLDDAFLQELARACPALREVAIDEVDSVGDEQTLPMITDAGLGALSHMPQLERITLKQSRASARGVLDLAVNAPSTRQRRSVVVKVGSADAVHHVRFTEFVLDVLALLTTAPVETIAGRRFQLELVASGARDAPNAQAERRALYSHVTAITAQHPRVHVHYRTGTQRPLSLKPPVRLERIHSVVITSM